MKARSTALAVGLTIATAASAQGPPAGTSPLAGRAAPAAEPKSDRRLFRSNQALPEPTPWEELGPPKIALPTGPVEPYLLQRHNGPFMVLAYTFRGPDAVRYAQALAMELRSKHNLPAYIFSLRIQPGHSNIRNVPPTAPPEVRSDEAVTPPERYRAYDEAAVLVGDCKSIDESEKLLHRVKKIRSEVVDGLPSIYNWRKGKGLSRAMLTTNPMAASQHLFPQPDAEHAHQHAANAPAIRPGATVDPSVLTAMFKPVQKPDPLIKQMNGGPYSIAKCPGPYTLQVAEFLGRSSLDPHDPRITNEKFLRQSPLAAAADQAETLAASLAKCKSLDKRFKPYVYHDRTSSRVFLGSFQSPNDPAAKQLLESINAISTELLTRKFTQLPLAPTGALTPTPRF
jgi:hypothetical protein